MRIKLLELLLLEKKTKINYGCALKGNLLKLIKNKLFKSSIKYDSAKLYAICIYLLVKEIKDKINLLIICNDADFSIVKEKLSSLLEEHNFEIINISEFRNRLGRKIGSLADNYANIYRRRALKIIRGLHGRKINIIKVNFDTINTLW